MAKTKAVARRNPSTGNPGPRRRRKKNSFTLPLGIVVPMAHIGLHNLEIIKQFGFKTGMEQLMRWFGADIRKKEIFSTEHLQWGLYPFAIGVGVHYAARRLGVNRALSRAGIPFIRI
ncbi:unnamed protein product [marine sediment metagenome]|uniref:Uncharacterized protein n=1 Tax=marine sediment metagenome TaxID=412755 RepID=X1LMA5_9ZZZZ